MAIDLPIETKFSTLRDVKSSLMKVVHFHQFASRAQTGNISHNSKCVKTCFHEKKNNFSRVIASSNNLL